ncbi:putative kh domain containing protein [Rhypophila decipiens]
MDDTERRTAKRSRFDQTEPEPRRASRFDRRSRSPPRRSEAGRDRSPLSRPRDSTTPDVKSPIDPAAAAAAAAARINAQLQSRKGIHHTDAPAVRAGSSGARDGSAPPANINGEMYVSDGDYIKDIEVNDLRNRYLITKGSTQKMIKDETGADVTTRGSYYPDKSMATPSNPPLYLHVTSTSKEGLEKAVAKIEEMMKQELPQLVDERRFRRREQEERPPVERDEFGRRKWPEEKIAIDMESVPGFNLRAQVVGHGGAYVKHIQNETGCRVQIKGRGSGFIEHSTQRESDEPMYLHVAGPDPAMVEKAKELCEDLVTNVREQFEQFKSRPPRSYNGGGGGGGYGGDRDRTYGDRSHGNSNSYQGYDNNRRHDNQHHGGNSSYGNSPAPPAASSATPPTATPTPVAAATDYAAQYAQYGAGGADPYAAYGGYTAYMQMYYQWYAAQAAQQGTAVAAPGSSTSPPPPPPTEAAPPPPPPSSAAPPPPPPSGPPGGGSYSAVADDKNHNASELSRPSLVAQYPVQPPPSLPTNPTTQDDATSYRHAPPIPASLAYSPQPLKKNVADPIRNNHTNSDPFILSPIVNLPPSFGSAYVGETFSCTLCVNHDVSPDENTTKKTIRDVKIEAEMKTPTTPAAPGGTVVKLPLSPPGGRLDDSSGGGVDLLLPGETLQKIVNFDLKDEGNHVLAVTVSYYEATETSGRTRTFRKLYQFICKASLIVRTKVGVLKGLGGGGRRWVLEAQLENCSEDAVQLEKAVMELEDGLVTRGYNWDVLFGEEDRGGQVEKPVLHPGEVEQVCFVIEEVDGVREQPDGRIIFGVLGIGWRGEMGNRGYLATGLLGTKPVK